nr:LysR substrate-binding domain-containing protein [Tianweitania sp.]
MSFTAAAQELCVTQGAISRQIMELEQLTGHILFERLHRSVALTREGEQLLNALTPAFQQMDDGMARLAALKPVQTLRISVEPSFATGWLIPHLHDFQASDPDIDLQVEADARLDQFREHEPELAIRWSLTRRSWPRSQAQHLADVQMTPVIAPSAMRGPIERPEDLLGYPLLHEENRDAWSQWFDAVGVMDPRDLRGPIFSDVMLESIRGGHGIGLGDLLFVAEDVRGGRLVRPFNQTISYGAYWLVCRDFSRLSPAAGRFAAWCKTTISGQLNGR